MSRFYKQEAKEKNIIMEVLPFTNPNIHDNTVIVITHCK